MQEYVVHATPPTIIIITILIIIIISKLMVTMRARTFSQRQVQIVGRVARFPYNFESGCEDR